MSVPFSALGMTVERSLSTRFVVALSAGPFLEMVLKYAVVPGWSIWIGVIAATPAVDEMSFCSVCRRGSPPRGSLCVLLEFELDELELEDPEGALAGDFRVTAISSGPFTPGPKFLATR